MTSKCKKLKEATSSNVWRKDGVTLLNFQTTDSLGPEEEDITDMINPTYSHHPYETEQGPPSKNGPGGPLSSEFADLQQINFAPAPAFPGFRDHGTKRWNSDLLGQGFEPDEEDPQALKKWKGRQLVPEEEEEEEMSRRKTILFYVLLLGILLLVCTGVVLALTFTTRDSEPEALGQQDTSVFLIPRKTRQSVLTAANASSRAQEGTTTRTLQQQPSSTEKTTPLPNSTTTTTTRCQKTGGPQCNPVTGQCTAEIGVETCPDPENGSLQRNYCYATWSYDTGSSTLSAVGKGCWLGDTDCVKGRRRCEHTDGLPKEGKYFCCCKGDMCNVNISFHPPHPSPPKTPSFRDWKFAAIRKLLRNAFSKKGKDKDHASSSAPPALKGSRNQTKEAVLCSVVYFTAGAVAVVGISIVWKIVRRAVAARRKRSAEQVQFLGKQKTSPRERSTLPLVD